jgi:hypothetical protein
MRGISFAPRTRPPPSNSQHFLDPDASALLESEVSVLRGIMEICAMNGDIGGYMTLSSNPE